MNMNLLTPETQITGINVTKTENEKGNPTTIVELGDAGTRLAAEFGRDGVRYCRMLSSKLTISSGDSIVREDKNPVVSISVGAPTENEVVLEPADVLPIRSILVNEKDSDEGYMDIMNRVNTAKEAMDWMKDFGLIMSRSEAGVLSHKSDYTFRIFGDSEVVVYAGDDKYIKSEGETLLIASKGIINFRTKHAGKEFEVSVRIAE